MNLVNLYISAFCLTAFLVSFANADGLENFIDLKMKEYPNWVKNNNFDPLPIQTSVHSFDVTNAIVQLEFSVSDSILQGHSGELYNPSYGASLLDGLFHTNIATSGNITFSGTYKARGTILSTIPINTRGRWQIKTQFLSIYGLVVGFEFQGFGNLNMTSNSEPWTSFSADEIYLDNLCDDKTPDGLKDLIKQSLLSGFYDFLGNNHIIKMLPAQFWQDVLSEATLADIIGGEIPSSVNPTKLS